MSKQISQIQNQMSREEIIKNVTMEFHTDSPLSDLQLFEDDGLVFGILQVTINSTPILHQDQVLDNNIDMSGSMEDTCQDGKSKMQHAKHTLKNIVTTVAKKPDASITMATYGFDDETETIFEDTKITQENAQFLRDKLNNLQPRNGTDIYKALKEQKERAETRSLATQYLKQTLITMTDGLANKGITDYKMMSTQVASNCTNVFIGFGKDHDAIGLQQLANAQPNGSYYYVAEIEKAGFVFGEIVHQILYTALTNITVEMDNAEIYDFKTNTWSQTLQVSSIVSEAIKTYHIRSKNPDTVTAKIIACSEIHGEQNPTIIQDDISLLPPLVTEEGIIQPQNLGVYILRQWTQEIIYKAHQESLFRANYIHHNINYNNSTTKKELQKRLKYIKKYQDEKILEDYEEEIVNTLVADLTITLQTFGSKRAAMYSGVRHTSQGREYSNNINFVDPEDNVYSTPRTSSIPHTHLRRQQATGGTTYHFCDNDILDIRNVCKSNEDEDEDEYEEIMNNLNISQIPSLSRTRTTETQMEIIRGVSARNNDEDSDEENKTN